MKNKTVKAQSNCEEATKQELNLGQFLDIWVEDDLKVGSMSNGTVELYQNIVKMIKRHSICNTPLTEVTSEQLQEFMDLISFGGMASDYKSQSGYAGEYAKKPMAVLNHAFRFAVFPKRFISYNPMQYVVLHKRTSYTQIFGNEDLADEKITPLTTEMYKNLIDYLEIHHPDAVLPVKISYYTGLRLGEVTGLAWRDVNLDEQYLTVRRSVSYDTLRHKTQIGTTKRAKIRTVDFGNDLAVILEAAKKNQTFDKTYMAKRYCHCYYKEVIERNRTYYEYYSLNRETAVPVDYHMIDFVCRKKDGTLMCPSTLKSVCRYVSKNLAGFENFHFHVLRHTYTTNLLANGARPKDVQELLGHSAIGTTMNIYAHATRESKKATARLLDNMVE